MPWIGLCQANQLRPPHEPTVREILSDPIVKAVMAAVVSMPGCFEHS